MTGQVDPHDLVEQQTGTKAKKKSKDGGDAKDDIMNAADSAELNVFCYNPKAMKSVQEDF